MVKNKFENIPQVFYVNSEDRSDLKNYTENNLTKIGISNFTRISDFEFSLKEYENWKHLVHNECKVTSDIKSDLSLAIIYIHTIKKWLENSNEKYMILMSDHVDYSYVQYFHDNWDWNYLMNNIPHDWDSILLGFEDLLEILPCFIHPMRDSHGNGVTLLNRKYAEKLVKLHYTDEKYNFFHKISNKFWKHETGFVTSHYFMNHCGKGYAIPMFPRHPEHFGDNYFSKESLQNHKKLYYLWWRKCSRYTILEDFYSYHSTKDFYLNLKNLKKGNVSDNNINRDFLIY